MTVRLGLIGAGKWGQKIIRTIDALEGISLAALASSNPISRQLVASDCHITGHWQDLTKSKDLDGIIIATPPALHAEMTLAAIEASVPVLVEKPLALGLETAQTILTRAQKNRTLVFVDHIYLYHPAYRALKKMALETNAVQSLSFVGGNHGPFRPDVSVLWDWGPHDIAMSLDLMDQFPKQIDASVINQSQMDSNNGEEINLKLSFLNDIEADIKLSNIYQNKIRMLTVNCNDKKIVFNDIGDQKLTIVYEGGAIEELSVSNELPLTCLIKEFSESIQQQSLNFSSLELAVDVVRVLSECDRKSQAKNQ